MRSKYPDRKRESPRPSQILVSHTTCKHFSSCEAALPFSLPLRQFSLLHFSSVVVRFIVYFNCLCVQFSLSLHRNAGCRILVKAFNACHCIDLLFPGRKSSPAAKLVDLRMIVKITVACHHFSLSVPRSFYLFRYHAILAIISKFKFVIEAPF